ncbi:MAG TPA: trans-aconitate 2-methyltransferase [Marmoricola sp.]|nr:trans-aconitate 2-methyltransferase [Marmoricola sp.]
MPHTWDPDRYLAYADERGRPFVELVARIGADAPQTVVDLGCGPGNLTGLLAARWPAAAVTGIDSSREMIAAASALPGAVAYSVGDVRSWSPSDPVDVLVSNATLQWVPGHLELLPQLLDHVRPGGWLAFQVPGNFDEPTHTIRRDLAAEAPYAAQTAGVDYPEAFDAATYLDVLAGLGCEVDAWETTYLHVLTGEDAVFTWVSGTGARPTLQALDGQLRPAYEAEFQRRLDLAYPPTPAGVVMPFRRVFVVARKPDGQA